MRHLNHAVVAQILHNLWNNQLCQIKAMGLRDEDLEALKNPAVASVLAHATVRWCEVNVSRNVLCGLNDGLQRCAPFVGNTRQAHPLNHAVIEHVLHEMYSGQFRRAKSLGFTNEVLNALKNPEFARLLVETPVCWCSVAVKRDVVLRLVLKAENDGKEIEKVDSLLRLGISTELASKFYGLPHEETATRRRVIAMPDHKGRWPALSEAQSEDLWHRYRAHIKAIGGVPGNDMDILNVTAKLAEETHLTISAIWLELSAWSKRN